MTLAIALTNRLPLNPTQVANVIRTILLGHRLEPFWRHFAFVLPVAILPAALLAGLATLAAHLVAGGVSDHLPPEPTFSVASLMGSIVLAPIAETLVMAITLPVIHFFAGRIVISALVSGLLWGLVHALLITPLAFAGPAWAFFVFSVSYLAWRPVSFGRAFAIACVPHAFNNSLVLAILFSFG